MVTLNFVNLNLHLNGCCGTYFTSVLSFPVSLQHTLQVAALAPNIRFKYFSKYRIQFVCNTRYPFYGKLLRDFYLRIEERSNFSRLSVYRSYTRFTDKFATHSVHQPFKQKVLYVGIFTPSHYLTS